MIPAIPFNTGIRMMGCFRLIRHRVSYPCAAINEDMHKFGKATIWRRSGAYPPVIFSYPFYRVYIC